MTDEQKIKQLKKFQKDFQKLMNKYPEILIMGDRNGDIQGWISLSLPSLHNNHGNIRLTWEGKVL